MQLSWGWVILTRVRNSLIVRIICNNRFDFLAKAVLSYKYVTWKAVIYLSGTHLYKREFLFFHSSICWFVGLFIWSYVRPEWFQNLSKGVGINWSITLLLITIGSQHHFAVRSTQKGSLSATPLMQKESEVVKDGNIWRRILKPCTKYLNSPTKGGSCLQLQCRQKFDIFIEGVVCE